MPSFDFVLASSSPRRRALCEEAGYQFLVDASQVDEPRPNAHDDPEGYAMLTAWVKARDVAERHPDEWVVGADTIVVGEQRIVGKPFDRDDAENILRSLMGTDHRVITGLCIVLPQSKGSLVDAVTSWVHMKMLTPEQLREHLDSGRWEGKAGAYGIQDRNDPFVTLSSGSGSNVVGLPMERLAELLSTARQAVGRS
ncbi:Maf family protein [bacterium]|nr:Maf family protein [bacterium]